MSRCDANENQLELEKDNLKIVKCSKCDLIYVNPIFNEDRYRQNYESKEYQNIVENLGESSHNYRVERFESKELDLLTNFMI